MKTKIEDTKRTPVYFPLDLLDKLQESAKENGRSLTKEVTQRLKQSYAAPPQIQHSSQMGL